MSGQDFGAMAEPPAEPALTVETPEPEAPAAATTRPAASNGNARAAPAGAASSARVRNIVGHRVMMVPATVSPIHPHTLSRA